MESNRSEIINEIFLLLSSYSLLYYTDYNNLTGAEDYKYNVGWIAMGLIVTVLFWNVGQLLKKTIYKIIKKKCLVHYFKKSKKRSMSY